MRERVYMPDAMLELLQAIHSNDERPIVDFSLREVMDVLAWCADVSPLQAREATYRLWGHMIEMNGGGGSGGR